MAKKNPGGGFDAFYRRFRSVEKGITEEEARLYYYNLDAVLALLAIPQGQRIVIDKDKSADRN